MTKKAVYHKFYCTFYSTVNTLPPCVLYCFFKYKCDRISNNNKLTFLVPPSPEDYYLLKVSENKKKTPLVSANKSR